MLRWSQVIHGAARQLSQIMELHQTVLMPRSINGLLSRGYKSHLSIDKVYPNSNLDFLRKTEEVS